MGPADSRYLDEVSLAEAYEIRMGSLRELIEIFDAEVKALDSRVHSRLRDDVGYRVIQRLNGVARVHAGVFCAEIGDITRFGSARHLCSWAGLTPRIRESDTKTHYGGITRQGSSLVRWSAVEAVSRYHGGVPIRDSTGASRNDEATTSEPWGAEQGAEQQCMGTGVWGLRRTVVEGVRFDDTADAIVVSFRPNARARGRCGRCGRRSPGYDQGAGRPRWRGLDAGTSKVFIEAEAPRIQCRVHGPTVAQVRWARHGVGHTRDFDAMAAWLVVRTSKSATCQLLRVAWRTIGSTGTSA